MLIGTPAGQRSLERPKRVGLGGLGVTCSPRDPRFAGSNPDEVDGFFRT